MSAPNEPKHDEATSDQESISVQIEVPEDSAENIVFTAVSSNHYSNFSSADTCCTCT